MADNLTFNVAQLLKDPIGATRKGMVVADVRRLVPDLEQGDDTTESELRGAVQLMHTTDGVLVQGHLGAQVTLPCSRCLEPVTIPFEIDLEEIFTPTINIITGQFVSPEEEDQALWIDDHHILDLNEVLRQDVLVSVPTRVLCRDDCRGLCPTCGRNRNLDACTCASEVDPRWARLAVLLDGSQ